VIYKKIAFCVFEFKHGHCRCSRAGAGPCRRRRLVAGRQHVRRMCHAPTSAHGMTPTRQAAGTQDGVPFHPCLKLKSSSACAEGACRVRASDLLLLVD